MKIVKTDPYHIRGVLMHDDAKSKILFEESWNLLKIYELTYEKEDTLFDMLIELERIGKKFDKPIILAVGHKIEKKMVESLRKYGFGGKGIMEDGNCNLTLDSRKGDEI